ncbi:MAG: hypothetical protein B6D56_02335 [Candidatus Omnitrophica bacterium 4484_70.1]|nr:MAG: hypothetical protein B6D56_02335 [Candidatus Omnitrophica bacterium 4484_70.1]
MNKREYLIKKLKEEFCHIDFKERKKTPERLIDLFINKFADYLIFLKKIDDCIKNERFPNISLEKKLTQKSNMLMKFAYKLENSISSLRVKKHLRKIFRKFAGKYIFQSKIIKHAYEKPYGYPGDYMLFEFVYDGIPLSEGIGWYFDKYALNHILRIGVVNRKNKMKNLLKEFIGEYRKVKIMNLGCGGCREIRELISRYKFPKRKIEFTCIDQDEGALKFAKSNFKKIFIPENIKLIFKKENIINIIGFGEKIKRRIKKDIIYSLGVADYFLDNVLERFIKFYYELLQPNGKLIFTLCSCDNSLPYTHLRWFCEWIFYTRSLEFTKKFIKDTLKLKSIKIIRESTHQIFFIIIEKNKKVIN